LLKVLLPLQLLIWKHRNFTANQPKTKAWIISGPFFYAFILGRPTDKKQKKQKKLSKKSENIFLIPK
jgi:hypothetical protein